VLAGARNGPRLNRSVRHTRDGTGLGAGWDAGIRAREVAGTQRPRIAGYGSPATALWRSRDHVTHPAASDRELVPVAACVSYVLGSPRPATDLPSGTDCWPRLYAHARSHVESCMGCFPATVDGYESLVRTIAVKYRAVPNIRLQPAAARAIMSRRG